MAGITAVAEGHANCVPRWLAGSSISAALSRAHSGTSGMRYPGPGSLTQSVNPVRVWKGHCQVDTKHILHQGAVRNRSTGHCLAHRQ